MPNKEEILNNIYNIHKEYKKIADAYPSIHPSKAGKISEDNQAAPGEQTEIQPQGVPVPKPKPKRSNSIISRLKTMAKNPKNRKTVEKIASRIPSLVDKIKIQAGRHPEFYGWLSKASGKDISVEEFLKQDPEVINQIISGWLKKKRSSQV